jgi:hypothetical protein
MSDFDYITVEVSRGSTYGPADDAPFAVYGYGEYESWSVLAGQTRRVWLGAFPSIDAALAEFPDAEVVEGSLYVEPNLDYLPDRNGVPFGDDVW